MLLCNTLQENKGTTPWHTHRETFVVVIGGFLVSVGEKGVESQKRKGKKYVHNVLLFVLPWDDKYHKYDVIVLHFNCRPQTSMMLPKSKNLNSPYYAWE